MAGVTPFSWSGESVSSALVFWLICDCAVIMWTIHPWVKSALHGCDRTHMEQAMPRGKVYHGFLASEVLVHGDFA